MQPKGLYKSKTNRVLFGVCGGLGEYFNIDPTIFRLIMLLAYIVAAIIIPEEY